MYVYKMQCPPPTIGGGKLFRIKNTFLRNKHEIAFFFFLLKCTTFGRKENTIRYKISI